METIVIEVDDRVAAAWRNAPEAAKAVIRTRINVSLAQELIKNSTQEYNAFLQTLRSEMSSAGLSQEELDNILRDE